jgi:Flp pilus assembly protein TadG
MFGERGGAAVEAALVTPVVMALLFGIIELGFLFKDYLAVAGSVRAANEVASTGGAMNLNDVQQMWVYKASATGLPDSGSFVSCSVCVKFGWNTSTRSFVATSDNWPAISQYACSAPPGPDRIGVYLQLKHNAFTKLVFTSVNIADHSVLTLEPMPVLAGCQ